jgi:internalin A
MSSQSKAVSRPWRRYLRFSVRGLIVTVFLLGGSLGWITRSARIQRNAGAAIRAVGGYVSYDSELRKATVTPAGRAWTRQWLMDFVGVDYFDRVDYVGMDFQATPADAAIVMAQVGRLPQLKGVLVSQSGVSGPMLVHLEGQTSLSELDLSETRVTDAGLAHLRGLTGLTELWLDHAPVTDAGLAHLKGLTNLTYLHLSHTQVTASGLAHLKGLTKLQVLDLSGTHVTDAGLEHLKALTELSDLRLSGTEVTHAAVEKLREDQAATVAVH